MSARIVLLLALFAAPLFGLAACRGAPLIGKRSVEVPDMRIDGNHHLTRGDLEEAARRYLQSFVDHARRPADADDAAFAMQTAYQEEGYPEARVRFEIEEGGTLVFHVEEGRRATVTGIRLVGVRSVPRKDVEALFDLPGSGFLSLGPPLLVSARLHGAVARVESTYCQRGYLRVRIEDPRLDWNADHTAAEVVVEVHEGRKYVVSGVRLSGADRSVLPREKIVGEPYWPRLPVAVGAQVRKKLLEEGYALAEVSSRGRVNDAEATAVIELEVKKGLPTRLREIHFEGAVQTKRSFLRDRFEIARGAPLRRSIVEGGLSDLFRSRLFRSANAEVVPVSPGWADLDVKLEEADTKQVEAEVGWGSWELLRGRAQYKDFDVFGIGRILRAEARASFRSVGGTLELEDPWILGQDNRLFGRIDVNRREERYYTYAGVDARVAFVRRIDRRRRVEGGYRFTAERATDIAALLPQDVARDIAGYRRAAGPYVIFRYDDRDDALLPTKGLYAEGRLRWSAPAFGGSLSFLEVKASATYTFDLHSLGSLAVGGAYRTIDPAAGSTLPIQWRYFLGGADSVRGFGQDELTFVDAEGNGIGALTAGEAHVEWRHQIVGELHGAAFTDVGVISQDAFAHDGSVGWGVGVGLRYYTPIGPVRLDGGYDPGPLFAAKRRWHAYFSFGFPF